MRSFVFYVFDRADIDRALPMDVCCYRDAATGHEQFGIRVCVDRKWCHLVQRGELVMYSTELEARQEIARLRGSARVKPSRRWASSQSRSRSRGPSLPELARAFPLRVVQHRLS